HEDETINDLLAEQLELMFLTSEQCETRWLGRAPAAEESVAAAERRLGVQFPPSLRGFLLSSDGWLRTGDWVDRVYSCAELDWMRNTGTGVNLLEVYRGSDEELEQLFERVLEVASGEDVWLLDPTDVAPDGEWRAYLFEPKYGDLEEFTGFVALFERSRELMVEDLDEDEDEDEDDEDEDEEEDEDDD
ncbi:MAG TPA: SMI1/KNR4 family protein, partial [Brevibacterium sp.]|nr:SMI1/KNR4 family protein [Brevibacterium sp.]